MVQNDFSDSITILPSAFGVETKRPEVLSFTEAHFTNSNSYHFEAQASARCHTQHGRHQGVCSFSKAFILIFTLFTEQLNCNVGLSVTLVEMTRVIPPKSRF